MQLFAGKFSFYATFFKTIVAVFKKSVVASWSQLTMTVTKKRRYNMEEIKIAAAYIRVSTEDQVEFSPASQLEKIKEYAKRNGYILPEEYIFRDEGISGRNTAKRPEFNRMIGTAKQKPKPFDTILLWKFSRFARNREDSIVYKSMLRKQCGIDVVSVSENIGDDKMSVLIEAMIEAMDEYYSINLSEEVKRGMTEKASRGGLVSGPPLGYKAVNGEAVIDPDTAPIVQKMFNDYLNGKTASKIAEWLNLEIGYRTRNGTMVCRRTVTRILKNPFYIGMIIWGDISVRGQHEPLISKDVFDGVQERIKSNPAMKYQREKSPKRPFMLQGLVKCDNCGSTLCHTAWKGKSETVQCGGYATKRCYVSHSITVKKLNEKVLTALEEVAALDDFLFEPSQKPEPEDNKHRVELLIKHEKTKLKRAKEAYENEVYSLEEYKETKQAVEKRISELEAELTNVSEKKDTKALTNKIIEALPLLRSDSLTEEEKNAVLKSFVSKIVYKKPSNDIDVYFYE